MSQWTDAPPGVNPPPTFKTLNDVKTYVKYLADMVAITMGDLGFIVNGNIDSRNTREIGGFMVSLIEWKAKNGTVGVSSEETAGDDIRFWAGDADKTNAPWYVTKGGLMHAAKINLSTGSSYPKVTLSTDDEFLGAFAAADRYIVVSAFTNPAGAPFLKFNDGGDSVTIDLISGQFTIQADITVSIRGPEVEILGQGGNITIYPAYSSGKQIIIPFFDTLYADQEGKTLQEALDEKADESEVVTAQATADAAQSDATAALALAGTKQNSFSGFTGTQSVITSVDFGIGTTTSKTFHIANGVITSIT